MASRAQGQRMSMNFSVLMATSPLEKPSQLQQALDSLAQQSLLPSELVLICDGLFAAPLRLTLTQFRQRAPFPVTLIEQDTRAGLGKSLAAGVHACAHAWVARMDSDDIARCDRFAIQADYLLQHPDIDVLGSHISEFGSEPGHALAVRPPPLDHAAIANFARRRNPMNHQTIWARRDKLLAAGNYHDVPHFEDYDLWVRMLRSGCRFANISDCLVHARIGDRHRFSARRGGWYYLIAESRFQYRMLGSQFIGLPRFAANMGLRALPRLLPKTLLALVYRCCLRTAAGSRTPLNNPISTPLPDDESLHRPPVFQAAHPHANNGPDGVRFTPEIQWILHTIQRFFQFSAVDPCEQGKPLDWQAIVEGAEWHRVSGILHRALQQDNQASVPTWVLQRFREIYQKQNLQTLSHCGRAIEIAKLLDRHAIPFVFLKGLPLAFSYYGQDLGLRPSRDIDLLVAPRHVTRVTALLEETFAYRRARPVHASQVELCLQNDCEWTLIQGGTSIDLHWHFSRIRGHFPAAVDQLLARSIRVPSGAYPLPALREDDHFLYLSFHAHKHMWNRLYWILDIALILHRNPDLVTPELLSRADEQRNAVPFALGAVLSRYLFQTAEHAGGLLLQSQPGVRNHLEYLLDFLRSEDHRCRWREPDQQHKWRWSTMTHPPGARRWQYALEELFRPSSSDLQCLLLPKALRGLYFLARPSRLLWQARRGFPLRWRRADAR